MRVGDRYPHELYLSMGVSTRLVDGVQSRRIPDARSASEGPYRQSLSELIEEAGVIGWKVGFDYYGLDLYVSVRAGYMGQHTSSARSLISSVCVTRGSGAGPLPCQASSCNSGHAAAAGPGELDDASSARRRSLSLLSVAGVRGGQAAGADVSRGSPTSGVARQSSRGCLQQKKESGGAAYGRGAVAAQQRPEHRCGTAQGMRQAVLRLTLTSTREVLQRRVGKERNTLPAGIEPRTCGAASTLSSARRNSTCASSRSLSAACVTWEGCESVPGWGRDIDSHRG